MEYRPSLKRKVAGFALLSGPALGTGVCLFADGAKYQLHFGQP